MVGDVFGHMEPEYLGKLLSSNDMNAYAGASISLSKMTLNQPQCTTLIVIFQSFIGLPCKDKISGDFPDGPVVRTPHSH